MQLAEIVKAIADILKEYDSERPIHKSFHCGFA